MKKLLTLILLFVVSCAAAQKQYQVGKETVFVPGQIVSTIKLVDYFNKQIGTMATHISFDNKEAIFTRVDTEEKLTSYIFTGVLVKDATKGLIPVIELKKAIENPDEKTNPKNYWDVSISFINNNKEVIKVVEANSVSYFGNEEHQKGSIKPYLVENHIVSFATKAAAEAFITSFKKFLK
jgi:hypothetical protein